MLDLMKKLLGTSNDRRVKSLRDRVVKKINPLEAQFEALSDDQLRAKTAEFREKIAAGAKLDDILNEAFAVTREAAKRTLGQRHYDVQLVGGMILHEGGISEMRTGEGKTLVATAPVYLNALAGKGVHVITVNDYLAARDADWMGRIYKFLGLSVGKIVHGLSDVERREAYACDVTYGTNNEFGFDYLRDNMKYSLDEMVQRPHYFAIVDEVDSILVDEARTPLIISGPTEDRTEFYKAMDALMPLFDADDIDLDEKQRQVTFSEQGSEKLEALLAERGMIEGSLWDAHNVSSVHHANQALRAHKLYTRDKDYIVKSGEVVLIDEFTGRMMQGRRLSEGLHQAIEAKEGANIQPENQTLASVTIQNYFRMYEKLAGMTGTASTEAAEFEDIYKMSVAEIPTNKPVARIDEDDVVYRSAKEKYKAILDDIEEAWGRGQPVLVGTVSIEKSEVLADLLQQRGFKIIDTSDATALNRLFNRPIGEKAKEFCVLNARYHEQEAHIVANAGVPGAITIATNMAGRGTDIQLGGNLEMRLEDEFGARQTALKRPLTDEERAQVRETIVADIAAKKEAALAAGGLYVLGTERHESRRIDNQLRGRTGRQGDPGRSKFYVSLEDDLLRIFAADRLDGMMKMLKIEEDEAITHPWMNKAMEISQKRVEQRNFEIRKNLLKYDDVINDQRKAVFSQRIDFMRSEDVSVEIAQMRSEVLEDLINAHLPLKALPEQWDTTGLKEKLIDTFGVELPVDDWAKEEGIANEEMAERINKVVADLYANKEATIGTDRMRWIEKQVLLQMIDGRWREHLSHVDHLRSAIHLRGYAQRDPLNEYKTDAFSMFEELLRDLRTSVTRTLMLLQIQVQPQPVEQPPMSFGQALPNTGLDEMGAGTDDLVSSPLGPMPRAWLDTPRNAACPCGSGKKFKHCHGSIGAVAHA
jgi:preprotein translocase subunit SecA